MLWRSLTDQVIGCGHGGRPDISEQVIEVRQECFDQMAVVVRIGNRGDILISRFDDVERQGHLTHGRPEPGLARPALRPVRVEALVIAPDPGPDAAFRLGLIYTVLEGLQKCMRRLAGKKNGHGYSEALSTADELSSGRAVQALGAAVTQQREQCASIHHKMGNFNEKWYFSLKFRDQHVILRSKCQQDEFYGAFLDRTCDLPDGAGITQ